MKKTLLVLCLFVLGGAFLPDSKVQAAYDVTLHVRYEDPTGTAGEMPRGPVLPPSVSIEDNKLYMEEVPFDVTLRILDEEANIVYTLFVTAYTPYVILPSTLSGTYELQLIKGNFCFYGYINL